MPMKQHTQISEKNHHSSVICWPGVISNTFQISIAQDKGLCVTHISQGITVIYGWQIEMSIVSFPNT